MQLRPSGSAAAGLYSDVPISSRSLLDWKALAVSGSPAELDLDRLEKQYERVLQEYRFQVQLNWDRAKHYLTFNTVLLGSAVALSKEAASATYAGISALLFLTGCNAWFGQLAVAKGHEYYRATRSTNAALERALNLGAHAILATPGMKRDHDIVPEGTPETAARRLGKVTQLIRLLFAVIGVFAFVGAAWAAWAAFQK